MTFESVKTLYITFVDEKEIVNLGLDHRNSNSVFESADKILEPLKQKYPNCELIKAEWVGFYCIKIEIKYENKIKNGEKSYESK